jgi:hypothetical protein
MIMPLIRWRRARLAARYCAALAVLTLAAAGTTVARASAVAEPAGSGAAPIVTTQSGTVRGAVVSGVYVVARRALAVVRQRGAGAVARAAAATDRDRLRDRAPLLVLGRRMTG